MSASNQTGQSCGLAPVIVIHSREQAIAALTAAARAGRRIVLASVSHSAGYLGPGWFRALVAAARAAVPEAQFSALLDCGDNVGAALAAIRGQVDGVIFTGRADVARRLEDLAGQHEVRLETVRPVPALDLGEDFFAPRNSLESRCTAYLWRDPSNARRDSSVSRADGPDTAAGHRHFHRESRDRADCREDRDPEGGKRHRAHGRVAQRAGEQHKN